MMKKITATLLILIFITTCVMAQSGLLFKGIVRDSETSLPIEYATVSIYSNDSVLIGGGVSELDGIFSIESKSVAGYLDIEFLSYEIKRIQYKPTASGLVDLGEITLSSSAISIDEITITAEKSTSQFLLDRKVFNVGQDLASRGGTAEDLLNNVPSISVDIEGNVSMRGGSNVRIFINGRPSNLVGMNGSNGLRSIQANMIERVEVITNPSARYEAEGMTGIINIILKKDTKGGFNSSFEVNGGVPKQFGVGANLNYRKGLTNFFLNYGFRSQLRPGTGYNFLERYDGNNTSAILSKNNRERNRVSNSVSSGLDFHLTEKQLLTASLTYSYNNGSNNSLVTYKYDDYLGKRDVKQIDLIQDYILRDNNEIELSPRMQYSLDYRKEFDEKDKVLSANLSYQQSRETEDNTYVERLYESNVAIENGLNQRSSNLEGERNFSGQIDFVQPINEVGRFELGARSTYRKIDNDFSVEELMGDVWLVLDNISNMFNYDEGVYGAYAIYGNKFEKFSYQGGLRYEYTHVLTELVTTSQVNNRNYGGLFPSGFLNYEFNQGNQVQVSYSRRIRRPEFRDLNPFFGFTDRINFFSGNPNLNPQYTNSFEVSHLRFWDWGNVGTSLYFRRTDDVSTQIKTINDDGTTFTKPENLGKEDNSGIELLASFSGLKWLKFDTEFNVFNSRFFDAPGRPELDASSIATRARVSTRITFLQGTEAQLRWNYAGPQQRPQGRQRAFRSLDLGISRDFFDDNLTATFNVNDVFNQRKSRYERYDDTFYELGENQWGRNSAVLTLSYRINSKKENKPDKKSNGQGSGEENGSGMF